MRSIIRKTDYFDKVRVITSPGNRQEAAGSWGLKNFIMLLVGKVVNDARLILLNYGEDKLFCRIYKFSDKAIRSVKFLFSEGGYGKIIIRL